VGQVIWNEDRTGYPRLLHDQIMGLIAAGTEVSLTDRPGGIFVRPADQIAEEDRILIQMVARVIIADSLGSMANQINGRSLVEATLPLLTLTRTHHSEPLAVSPLSRYDLALYNRLGEFTPDGREYVTTTAHGQVKPAP
jgi:cyclic beta-1,2-glucan synthetase